MVQHGVSVSCNIYHFLVIGSVFLFCLFLLSDTTKNLLSVSLPMGSPFAPFLIGYSP